MQGVYQSKQGEQQLPSSVLKDQSCGTAENRVLLGKGLVVMAGQEFVPVKPQKRTVSDMVFTF